MTKKPLNEKQKLFLEVLLRDEDDGGAGGDFVKAKHLAGYHPTYSTRTLVETLKEDIEKAVRDYFTQVAPRAAMKITRVMESPTDMGAKEILASAKDLLDRAGMAKVDKVDVSSSGGGIFILPPKDES